MAVESEYRLKTREGVDWTHDFNRSRTAVLNDDQRINSKRAELLREGVKQALKPVSLQQGTSRQPRKIASELLLDVFTKMNARVEAIGNDIPATVIGCHVEYHVRVVSTYFA
jgi:hypothetical protein